MLRFVDDPGLIPLYLAQHDTVSVLQAAVLDGV